MMLLQPNHACKAQPASKLSAERSFLSGLQRAPATGACLLIARVCRISGDQFGGEREVVRALQEELAKARSNLDGERAKAEQAQAQLSKLQLAEGARRSDAPDAESCVQVAECGSKRRLLPSCWRSCARPLGTRAPTPARETCFYQHVMYLCNFSRR